MIKNYTYRCFKLHYCADINLDKSSWDKYKKKYKNENDKILDVLKIGKETFFFLCFDLKKIEKKEQYHLQIDINKIGNRNDSKKIIEKLCSETKRVKVLEQSIKKLNFLEQKLRTTQKIQCSKGHLLASYYFETRKFRSTIGIPFEVSPGIWDTEKNVGQVTIESLGFAFKNSATGLQKARTFNGKKNIFLDLILNQDIIIDNDFLQNLFNITNDLCPLFVEGLEK